MKLSPSISQKDLEGASVRNLRRLCDALGVDWSGWVGLPDERTKLVYGIMRWYKRNPPPKRRRRGRRDRSDTSRL